MLHRWCKSAYIRKSQIESGKDITFEKVLKPFIIDRIKGSSYSSILEIGAGTGHLAKEVYQICRNITAIEPSEGMFAVAEKVLEKTNITLLNTKVEDLDECIKFQFAYSNLVLHTIENISSALQKIISLLTKNGIFLFSIPHPCFYNNYKNFFKNFVYIDERFEEVSFNITRDKKNKIENVPYYHRPLSMYINSIIKSGLNLLEFCEVFPEAEIQKLYGKMWETPRYCFFVCQK